MKRIQVFERDKIRYGNGHELTKDQFDSLVKYNDRNDQKFFNIIHRGIQFTQYVGVVKVGNLVIEISPKLDDTEVGEEHHTWQRVLINMLRECRILSPEAPSQADLRLKAHSLLDLYFEMFVGEVEYLKHRGLIKRYVQRTENKTAVKGKIDFSTHIRKNVVHKERFYVTYKEYSHDHLLNQILLKTLNVIEQVSEDLALQGRIKKLSFALPDLGDITVNEQLFSRISFDRKSDKYRNALQVAELLLLNYSPDVLSGQNNVLALLFDMEQLFEEYVYRRLQRLFRKSDFTVQRQRSKVFWRSRSIRPDIILERGDTVYVLDTKWKSLSTVNPDMQDLRQMYVYNQYFGAKRSILVYPRAKTLDHAEELYQKPADLFTIDGEHIDHGCMIYFMPIVTESGLNFDASQQLVDDVIAR